MKRIVVTVGIIYLILASVGRAQEAAGTRTCGCDPDCWCKRPGLSLFRWVFPRFHRNRELEKWKRQQVAD